VNEANCRGDDFVEIVNAGDAGVDLAVVVVRRATGDTPFGAGVLLPGARAVFRPAEHGFGYECGVERVKIVVDDSPLPEVALPLLPGGATFGRVPDGTGPFQLSTSSPGAVNSAWVDDASRLFTAFDAPVPDLARLPRIDLAIAAGDIDASNVAADVVRAELAAGNLNAPSPPYVSAQLTFTDGNGAVDEPMVVGVRIKGQSVVRRFDQKPALKIDADRIVAGGHLLGVEKLTLNNLVQDNSASHERAFYGLLANAGLPATRTGYVDVYVNGERLGVYLALEAHDDPGFLGRTFASTQVMYEGEYGQDLFIGNEGVFDQDFGVDVNRAALAAVTSALNNAPSVGLRASTEAFIDWDQVLANMAAELVLGHWDSYAATKNNFSLHIDRDGRLRVLSAGADQSFTVSVPFREGQGRLLVRCLEDDVCAGDFDAAVVAFSEQVDTWRSDGGQQRLVDDAQTLVALTAADTRREWNNAQIPALVNDMLSFLDAQLALSGL
jgi:hypothetical protein